MDQYPPRPRHPIFSSPRSIPSINLYASPYYQQVTKSQTESDNNKRAPLVEIDTRQFLNESNISGKRSESKFESPFKGVPLVRSESCSSYQNSIIKSNYSRNFQTIQERDEELSKNENVNENESRIRSINRSIHSKASGPFQTPQKSEIRPPTLPPIPNRQLRVQSSQSSVRESSNPSNLSTPQRKQGSILIIRRSENQEQLILFLGYVNRLTGGYLLLKYGRSDLLFPQRRIFSVSPDLRHIVLKTEAHEIRKMLPLNHIMQIQLGRRTENFKRFKSDFQKEQRSCSLMMKERTMDLEACDADMLTSFVESLSFVLQISINKGFIGVEFDKDP